MSRPPTTKPPVSSALARQSDRKDLQNYVTIQEMLNRDDRRADLLAVFGGDVATLERFMAVALHAIASDSKLLKEATPLSIIQAVRDSATLGLEPTGLTSDAWIVCYGDQAKLMPGWRGYLRRIRNSRQVQDIDTQLVYANDEFDYGKDEHGAWFKHHPMLEDPGDYRGAYAYAVMPSGFVVMEYMSTAEINYVRDTFAKTSKADTPWKTSWGEMARKTVLRRLAKRLPQEAVDQLLRLDAEADAAREASTAEKARFSPTAARQAALRAVGAEEVVVSTLPPDEAPEASTPDGDPDLDVREAHQQAEVIGEMVTDSDLSDLPQSWAKLE